MANVFPFPVKLWVGCNQVFGEPSEHTDGLLQIKLRGWQRSDGVLIERTLGTPTIPRKEIYIPQIKVTGSDPFSFKFEIPASQIERWGNGIQDIFGSHVAWACAGIAANVLNGAFLSEEKGPTQTEFDILKDLATGELKEKLKALHDELVSGRMTTFERISRVKNPEPFQTPRRMTLRVLHGDPRLDDRMRIQITNFKARVPQNSYVSAEAFGTNIELGITNPHLVKIESPWFARDRTNEVKAARELTKAVWTLFMGATNAARTVAAVSKMTATEPSRVFLPDLDELAVSTSSATAAFLNGQRLAITSGLEVGWSLEGASAK